MNFETYKPRRGRARSEPQIRIYKNGQILLTRAAYELLGNPSKVDLLFDSETGTIGIRANEDGYHTIKDYHKRVPTVSINAFSFLEYYGADVKGVVYYSVKSVDGFICTGERL